MPPKKRSLPPRIGGKFKKTAVRPVSPTIPALSTSETLSAASEIPDLIILDDPNESLAENAYAIFLDDPEDPDFEFNEDMLDQEDRPAPVKQMKSPALRDDPAKAQKC
jgi:hypothetical protein